MTEQSAKDTEALEADARVRVAAGVAWLDEHRPDWRERAWTLELTADRAGVPS